MPRSNPARDLLLGLIYGVKIIGLDIGGSKIDGILWQDGKILNSAKIKTPRNRKGFLESLSSLIKGLTGGKEVKGIGIAMAGAIDIKSGVVMKSPNMKFVNNFSLAGFIQKKFRRPVAIDNDTHCFLLGESRFGAIRGKKNVVALSLGTGTGGAVLIEGQMLRGKDGAAGELGQIIIEEAKGKFYTVEDLISGHGFARYSKKRPREIESLARKGNRRMIKIYKNVGKYLGIALANYINIFNPEIIVIGGGISHSGKLILRPAIREMKKHALIPPSKYPIIKISKLEHAGALGAVALFFSKN